MEIFIVAMLLIVALVKYVGKHGGSDNDVDDYIYYNGHRYYRRK